MSSIRRTRTTLSIRQRENIIERLANGEHLEQLAAEYNIHPNSVRRIKRNSERIRQYSGPNKSADRITMKMPVHDTLDTKLYAWFAEKRALGVNLTGQQIQDKALQINREINGPDTFKASNGWLDRFKKRCAFRQFSACEEKDDALIDTANNSICDVELLIDEHEIKVENIYNMDVPDTTWNFNETQRRSDGEIATATKFISDLVRLIKEQEIKLENIYSMVVTGLAWKYLPRQTFTHSREETVISKEIRKERVTLGLCANATGSQKLLPLFIHKYSNPRALKHCKNDLPVVFMSEYNTCLNQQIFNSWYENNFKPGVKKRQLENHVSGKVLLIVNNCAEHEISGIQESDNIEVKFLPSNAMSIIQPMDQCIIEKIKMCFREQVVQKVLAYPGGIYDFYDDYDIKDCIDIVYDAWNNITPADIQNSWGAQLKPGCRIDGLRLTGHSPEDITSLQTALAAIANNISSHEVKEWLNECSQIEKQVLQTDEDETAVERVDTKMDEVFYQLGMWSEWQPNFIKQQVKNLTNYYKWHQKH